MATSQKYIKGGISINCDVSLYPAPGIQASWPIPNFPAVQASPHVLSTVAISGQGAQGLQVAASAALPGGPTAQWTLHHQAYQGSAPATLPTADVTPLTVTPGASQQVLATINYPLAGATHIVWLQSVEAGVTTVYPPQTIITPADPTQGGISTAGAIAASALAAAEANASALAALGFTGLGTTTPLMDSGTGGDGTSTLGARQDHYHPTDTSRASTAAFGASGASHAAGLVPDPGAVAGATRYLREDESWDVPPAPPVFGASGTGHSMGLVPDPGTTAGTTRFLCETGAFAVPPSSGGSSAVFVGSGPLHAAGLVPDPGAVAGTTKFLREDGGFAVPPGGSGWPWIPIALTPPNPTAFTWVNQSSNGGATATLQTGQSTMYFPSSSSNNISAMQASYSGVKRCVLALCLVSLPNSGATSAGIYVGDGSGKLIEFAIINYGSGVQDTTFFAYQWNSPASPNAQLYGGLALPPCPGPLFLSVYDDGTNLNFQVSADGGQNWDTLFTQARSAFLSAGPNSFGWGMRTEGLGKLVRANFLHWSVS